MTALLICPAERPGVAQLSRVRELALLPLLGQSLLEYSLSHLAASGFTSVTILTHERPEQVLEVVGNGARWGLGLEVIHESRELTPSQAFIKYGEKLGSLATNNICTLDHFPGSLRLLFESYREFFGTLIEQIPSIQTPERVGVRERAPGILAGAGAFIHRSAVLEAPCWIGDHVYVGAKAKVGPGGLIEAGSFIEPEAEVVNSYIGPNTFVGRYARLVNSLALGDTLVDWEAASETRVPDPFLLCALRTHRKSIHKTWMPVLFEMYNRNKTEILTVCKHLLMRKES